MVCTNEPFPIRHSSSCSLTHYIYRMLYSQGISFEDLEIGQPELKDARKVWRIFRQSLLSVPRNADTHVAGLCVPDTFRT